MGQETSEWYNNYCLIGYAAKRGTAWHYRESAQGAESNHYDGAVPVDDVVRRLLDWEPLAVPLTFTWTDANGTEHRMEDPTRQVIFRPPHGLSARALNGDAELLGNKESDALTQEIGLNAETGRNGTTLPPVVFGVFKDGYTIHPYREWLIETVSRLMDTSVSDLGIANAVLLRNGGQMAVQYEVPETFTTPQGVEYRPSLLAATSIDGTLATTFKRVITNVVCDNTMGAALGENGQQVKIKHSKYSGFKINDAREALDLVFETSNEFEQAVKELTERKVTGKQFLAFVDMIAPMPDDKGRAATMADAKRQTLQELYVADPRVAPWQGSAYGVVQLMNTYSHHYTRTNSGTARGERNMFDAVTGKFEKEDNMVLATLNKILENV